VDIHVSRIGDEVEDWLWGILENALSFAAAFIRRCRRRLRKHHLRLNHHGGKLSVWAVYRGLQDDHAPPHMDRYSNAGQPPWHAGAKDIRLRFDRGCPKPRRHVEPGQPPAEIIGERRQRTAMHMAAVVEMTVIDIEFADQLILGGVGNSDAKMSRHAGTCMGNGHREYQSAATKAGDLNTGMVSLISRWLLDGATGSAARFRSPLRGEPGTTAPSWS
jgi:hypothetical protein